MSLLLLSMIIGILLYSLMITLVLYEFIFLNTILHYLVFILILLTWSTLNSLVLLKSSTPIMLWSIETPLYFLFSLRRALLFNALVFIPLNKMDVQSVNINTFFTLFAPNFFLHLVLRNFRVRLLLHLLILSTVFLLLSVRISPLLKDFMVLFLTTLDLKLILVMNFCSSSSVWTH